MSGDDDARTWRDLIDQLTREQIAELAANDTGADDGGVLLSEARNFAEQNMIESIYCPDPLPADAIRGYGARGFNGKWRSYGWQPDDDGKWWRGFEGTRYVVTDAVTETVDIVERIFDDDDNESVYTRSAPVSFWFSVEIYGEQGIDGTVTRVVTLDHGPTDQSLEITEESWEGMDLELSANTARRLADALTAAADEIDKLREGVNDA